MDAEYFESFTPTEISTHIQMADQVDVDHRVLVRVARLRDDEFDIVIVGYDYPSGLSILSGLMSAFGLDIRAGEIYSFSREASRKSSAALIVDVLKVAAVSVEAFDEARQREFESELMALTELLASGSQAEARERLNRFLIERIEKMGEALAGLTAPVELTFNNELSKDWTVMEARSLDAFAFLYATSNALAMRGIYIHRVRIRSEKGQASDQFFIVNRWNRRVESESEQQRLRMTVSMIKGFTHFLPEAPDPAGALRHFDQFLDKLIEISEDASPDGTFAFLASSEGMTMLAHLLGSSDFLWDDLLRIHFSELLPLLEQFVRAKLEPGPRFKAALREELRDRLSEGNTLEAVSY